MVFWLYGLSAAGKSTLACQVAEFLWLTAVPTMIIDGDELRKGLCSDLAYDLDSRFENVRRAAEIAKIASTQGQTVLVALMTPSLEMRKVVSRVLEKQVVLILVKCDYQACAKRDPKGLYQRASGGDILNLPGKDMDFCEDEADYIINTQHQTIEECCDELKKIIRENPGVRNLRTKL